jgi:sugar/nucleoside kinase (ribokinase family)
MPDPHVPPDQAAMSDPGPTAASRPPRDLDCLLCGTCVADILVRPVPLTAPVGGGRLLHVDPITVTTGGVVCNTGIAMRRLGMRVAAASLVGGDLWGDVIRAHLVAEEIDITALDRHPTLATSTTAALIDPGGERSFAHHVGAPQALDLGFLRRHVGHFARARFAVLGYFGLLPGLEPVFGEAVAVIRDAGCRVAVETAGSGGAIEQLAPALPFIDLFVPSLDEAIQQTGLTEPRDILACYRDHGAPGIVGVKLGARGVVLSPAAEEWLELPCVMPPGPVADTTGAGDSLLAGLLTGLLQEMPLADAGRLGAATAACCITGIGATAGLRSFDDTCRLAGVHRTQG